MAKQLQSDIDVSRVGTTLYTDCDPIDQPRGTHRYALNAINEAPDGYIGKLINEQANINVEALPEGFLPIGHHYLTDDLTVVISTHTDTGVDEIGLLDKRDKYTSIVTTTVLDMSISNQCSIVFRLRKGNERVIYWVDGLNRARTFNLDRVANFYNTAYKVYLKSGGDPLAYIGEKWDGSSFDLIKSYASIPFFSDVNVIETGSILPGSYNFAVQYVDDDLNPTEWISTSNIVRIYNDTQTNSFEKIRGSKNITSAAQTFGRANKSIKLTITNLDTNFPYYRIGIIRAAGINSIPDKVLASDVFSTSDSNFIYTGNDDQLTEVNIADILIGGEVIYAPRHIEQTENRLELGHVRGKGINWCDFQQYASKIGSDLCTQQVVLNSISSPANPKNAHATFVYRGYMPGEVHSFGIVYIFSDGYISPVFHIPGKSVSNTLSKMGFYQTDSKYLDIHNCSVDNYWGKDIDNNNLVSQNVRHHRFPFRKDVNKPLFTRNTNTNNITRHRLKVTFSLAVGKTFPIGTDSITYQINYQLTGAATQSNYSGVFSPNDITNTIAATIYDDVNTLDDIAGAKGVVDPSCQLNTYLGADPTFVVTYTYEDYVSTSSNNQDTSEIFGIEFNNIQKPHPDVIGFYIVRNERTDDDKLIMDNAIFGSMTEFQQYKSFAMLTPKQYYEANNCGRVGNSGKSLQYYSKGVFFFNPEFQFFNKRTDFDRIEVEGVYSEGLVSMPSISNDQNSTCNTGGSGDLGGSKGLYINDVQAGTTYNPSVDKAKNKDDDGFDLLVGYKNTDFTYAINNSLVFPAKRLVLYLNAASYQAMGADIYYNVSVDNKIGEYLTDDDLSADLKTALHDTTGNTNGLIYGSLVKDNPNAYANFINRPYYKEHNNPFYFGTNSVISGVKIFNGDAEISAMHIVSSVFYDIVVADRAKKTSLWSIIAGAAIIAASVAAAIITFGASIPLSALGISYGVSLITSGIKLDQMKSMIDDHYEKGLKETVTDGALYSTIRDTVGRQDDTIRWFSDRVSNIYIESSVPISLRAGLTDGTSDFMDAPIPYDETAFRTYLTGKFTILDRDQGSGRLYKGYASAEYYDVNKDYLRFNKQKQFSHLPMEYDCCADQNEVFPNRVWYSEQSFQEENVDTYRVFLPNNYKDIEGIHGEITNMYRLGNSLFIETTEALWQLPESNQERVTGEIVSFIGTGDFFSIPPKMVQDDNLGSGGTQHKWGTLKTRYGVISINELEHNITLNGSGFKDITVGNKNWFKNNLRPFLNTQLYKKGGINYLHDNNPANPLGIGYISAYDIRHERVLITKKDYAILQDKESLLAIVETLPLHNTGFVYAKDTGKFYNGLTLIDLDNQDFFENKSWTMSYSLLQQGFVGWHSYLPNCYIYTKNSLYGIEKDSSMIWKFNDINKVQTYFGKYAPFIVEYVQVNNPLTDRTFEDLTIQTRARKWDAASNSYIEQQYTTFNKVICHNSRQSSGELIMRAKDLNGDTNNWYQQQTVNQMGAILIDRNERNWSINDIRDYVIDYTRALFTNDWNIIRYQYPIDKVPNPVAIDFAKPWQDLQVLRDKYVIIRLKFDNFNDVNLIFNYTLDNEPISPK